MTRATSASVPAAASGKAGAAKTQQAAHELFGQLLSRSSYAARVRSDVEEHGPALAALGAQVLGLQPTNLEEVVAFVGAAQRGVLSALDDECAVLKALPEWPAARWEALEEAAVTHSTMAGLRAECQVAAQRSGTASSSHNTTATSWGRIAHHLATAATAARVLGSVCTRVEAYQRGEAALDKRMRAHGVPWQPGTLVTGVKVAAVQLGCTHAAATLAALRAVSDRLQELRTTTGEPRAAAEGVPGALSGAAVLHARREEQALRAARRSALDSAVEFFFRLHQFCGGLDKACHQAFVQLATEVEAEDANAYCTAPPPKCG